MAVSFLSRSSTFFVNTQTVLFASISTFFFSYVIQGLWPMYRNTVKEPQKDKLKTGFVYFSIIMMFMMFMVVATFAGVEMYDSGSQAMNAAAAKYSNYQPLI